MRNLNAKQKKMLNEWQDLYNVVSYDQLNEDMQTMLDRINMFENVISCVDRYLHDRKMEKMYGSKK